MANSKYNMLFFYSHSKLSKYFIENLDFILKVEHLLSPAMRLRILEGSFVNHRGGVGNNIEADLAQEHSVRNRKDLIRQLGVNKSERAMSRITNAADAITSLVTNLDKALGIRPTSCHHTKNTSAADANKLRNILREVRPFHYSMGRQCDGFNNILPSPLMKIKATEMRTAMSRNIRRLAMGMAIPQAEDEDLVQEEDLSGDEVDGLPEM